MAGLARADDARAPTTPMESVTESSREAAIGSSVPTESTTPVTDTSGVPTTTDTSGVPTTADTVPTTVDTVPTTGETVPTTDELAASAPPPVADQSSAGPVASGAGARPAAVSAGSTARPSVAVPAAVPAAPAVAVAPALAPPALASTGAPVIAPAIVPSVSPALGVGRPAVGPVQRPEIIPNVFTIAEQVSQWKLLLVIVTMSGLGAGALLHLGRRDQAAMDAIHLDLMLGIEREMPRRSPS